MASSIASQGSCRWWVEYDILRRLAMQVRNWGRWGPDDEIGTLAPPLPVTRGVDTPINPYAIR